MTQDLRYTKTLYQAEYSKGSEALFQESDKSKSSMQTFLGECMGFGETRPAGLTLSCSVHIPDPWPKLLQKDDHIFVNI